MLNLEYNDVQFAVNGKSWPFHPLRTTVSAVAYAPIRTECKIHFANFFNFSSRNFDQISAYVGYNIN